MSRRTRRAFTQEFKPEAVGLTLVDGRSIAQVAKDLDLTETAVEVVGVSTMDLNGHDVNDAYTALRCDAL